MDLSIILVNWNSTDFLLECLASVHHFTADISFEVIVVDNASTVQDLERLTGQFPLLKLVRSPENLGFAQANNLGFGTSSGERLLFLNPDTKLQGPAINIMFESLNSLPEAGVLGCRLLNTDSSLQTSCIQKFPTILNQLLDVERLQLRWPDCRLWGIGPLFRHNLTPSPVEAISGACMMVRRAVFEAVGGFSRDYFMYAEDLDLCYKVARAGFTNYYIGQATIVHHGGKSSQQRRVNQWATVMKFRAVQRFCAKTRGRAYGFCYRLAIGCSAVGRLAFIALAYPFFRLRSDTRALRNASSKWSAVFQWAFGLKFRYLDVVSDR